MTTATRRQFFNFMRGAAAAALGIAEEVRWEWMQFC